MIPRLLRLVLLFFPVLAGLADHAAEVEIVGVAPVWAGHPVGFALLTHRDWQFVAFYDAERQMTLARRKLGSHAWEFKKLPTFLGWDSHNSIALALDRDGCLHVSGNMHVAPLIYFRGSQPLDIDSVEPVPAMTGQRENRVTYPTFYTGSEGDLLFLYRDGRSGSGNNIINVYDERTRSWRRLSDVPLMDGGGVMNAYMLISEKKPDGWYHVTWVWREALDAAANRDLSYMRTRDWRRWETVDGKPLTLPIVPGNPDVMVDPVRSGGGLLNGSGRVGLGPDGKVWISYFKYDAAGNTQAYIARFEDGTWKISQISDWDYRWEFGGKGSLQFEVTVGAVKWEDGRLSIPISHKKYGSGIFEIDPDSLKLGRELPASSESKVLTRLAKVESDFPGMEVRWTSDQGWSDGRKYRLRWETLPPNRDKPRESPWPAPSMLSVIGVP